MQMSKKLKAVMGCKKLYFKKFTDKNSLSFFPGSVSLKKHYYVIQQESQTNEWLVKRRQYIKEWIISLKNKGWLPGAGKGSRGVVRERWEWLMDTKKIKPGIW